jgi:hypothetical protein
MNGTSHQFVANLALACLDIRERHILYPLLNPSDGTSRVTGRYGRFELDMDSRIEFEGVLRL